jgi:hypothetical protein
MDCQERFSTIRSPRIRDPLLRVRTYPPVAFLLSGRCTTQHQGIRAWHLFPEAHSCEAPIAYRWHRGQKGRYGISLKSYMTMGNAKFPRTESPLKVVLVRERPLHPADPSRGG